MSKKDQMKETILIKGIAKQLYDMKFPKISNLKEMLNAIGYDIVEFRK